MKQKNITFLIAIFSFIILNTLIAFNIYKNKFISQDIVRLHVVANSNNLEDQIVKLKIETKIKDYIYSLNSSNKKELINNIKENKDEILNIANLTLEDSNKTYSSSLKVGKIYYGEKQNMLLDMDSGTYDSASLILGDGNGKNIWSMIFPNEKTIDKVKELDTIIPELSNIYRVQDLDENDITTSNSHEIKSKLLSFIKGTF